MDHAQIAQELGLGMPLSQKFFERPARDLAPRLLGCFILFSPVALKITEVEAYEGPTDPGSHAFRGKTQRNASMFGPAGHLYVYRHMGLHTCMNIVASTTDHANGCLIRAAEVVAGADTARARRAAAGVTRSHVDLAQGPARLTVCLGISHDDDGTDLCSPAGKIKVYDRLGTPPQIRRGPRIGLRPEATNPKELWLRFWIDEDPTVSGSRTLNRSGEVIEV